MRLEQGSREDTTCVAVQSYSDPFISNATTYLRCIRDSSFSFSIFGWCLSSAMSVLNESDCCSNPIDYNTDGLIRQAVEHFEAQDAMNPSEKLKIFLTNCRGLKQAAGELRQRVNEFRPHLIMLDECHLSSKDSIQGLLPPGYKVIVRLDRTRKGGGQIIAGLSHLLIDKLDLAAYNIKAKVELIGVILNGKLHVLAYTPKSSFARLLIEACSQIKLDCPYDNISFYGDFNVHNEDWICSKCTDAGGLAAADMCTMFGLNQLVGFSTRSEHTLDLVMTPFQGRAYPKPGLGTSDHISIEVTLDTSTAISK